LIQTSSESLQLRTPDPLSGLRHWTPLGNFITPDFGPPTSPNLTPTMVTPLFRPKLRPCCYPSRKEQISNSFI